MHEPDRRAHAEIATEGTDQTKQQAGPDQI